MEFLTFLPMSIIFSSIILLISLIFVFSLFSIKSTFLRFVLVFKSLFALPLSVLLIYMMLGQGKPIGTFNILAGQEYEIVYDFFMEDEKILLLLINENLKEPLYISLPWDIETAKKIQEAKEKAGESGKITIKFENIFLTGPLFNDGLRSKIEPNLPKPPPLKSGQ